MGKKFSVKSIGKWLSENIIIVLIFLASVFVSTPPITRVYSPPSVNFGLLANTMPNCLVAVIDAITLPFASAIATVSPALPFTFAV